MPASKVGESCFAEVRKSVSSSVLEGGSIFPEEYQDLLDDYHANGICKHSVIQDQLRKYTLKPKYLEAADAFLDGAKKRNPETTRHLPDIEMTTTDLANAVTALVTHYSSIRSGADLKKSMLAYRTSSGQMVSPDQVQKYDAIDFNRIYADFSSGKSATAAAEMSFWKGFFEPCEKPENRVKIGAKNSPKIEVRYAPGFMGKLMAFLHDAINPSKGDDAADSMREMPHGKIIDIANALKNNKPVMIGYDAKDIFYNKSKPNPISRHFASPNHMSVVIGMRANDQGAGKPGSCQFLLRNSWGENACEKLIKEGKASGKRLECDVDPSGNESGVWIDAGDLTGAIVGYATIE